MSLIPTLRYADPDAALRFHTDVLGLTAGAVHRDGDGVIAHAEVWWEGEPLLFSARRPGGDSFDTGRAVLYLPVDDVDAHHDRVVAAGGEVTMPLVDQDYGSREFAVLGPEGHSWTFGTYRPTP